MQHFAYPEGRYYTTSLWSQEHYGKPPPYGMPPQGHNATLWPTQGYSIRRNSISGPNFVGTILSSLCISSASTRQKPDNYPPYGSVSSAEGYNPSSTCFCICIQLSSARWPTTCVDTLWTAGSCMLKLTILLPDKFILNRQCQKNANQRLQIQLIVLLMSQLMLHHHLGQHAYPQLARTLQSNDQTIPKSGDYATVQLVMGNIYHHSQVILSTMLVRCMGTQH